VLYITRILFLSSALSLIGCSALPDQDSIERRSNTTVQNHQKAGTEVQNATASLSTGLTENLAFFAPTYWSHAKTEYENATKMESVPGQEHQIKRAAALSQEYIAAGLRNKKIVIDTLSPMLKHKALLDNLKANETLPTRYASALSDMKRLIQLVEQQNIDEALSQQRPLLIQLKSLEVQAVDAKYLHHTHQLLALATELGAQEVSALTFEETQNQIKDAQQFIRQNPNERLKIAQLASRCEFSAQRLVAITKAVQQLMTASPTQLESYVRLEEQRLHRIAQSLGMDDMRNQGFEQQSRLMASQGEQNTEDVNSVLNDPNKISAAQLEKWKRKTALLQAEVRRLEKLLH